jgi:hypothetical protein
LRFEVLTAMNIQIMVFWAVTLCRDAVGYKLLEDHDPRLGMKGQIFR